MKNWIKKYLDIIAVYLITLIICVLLFYFFANKIEIIGVVLATGISVSFGIRQYRIENDKMFKELFENFNKKYDEKFNDKLNIIDKKIKKSKEFLIDEKDVPLIIDYLNFCSEEYLWYTKGRIPDNVWLAWENGMLYFLNLEPINRIVQTQKEQKDSYYGLFEKPGKSLKNF